MHLFRRLPCIQRNEGQPPQPSEERTNRSLQVDGQIANRLIVLREVGGEHVGGHIPEPEERSNCESRYDSAIQSHDVALVVELLEDVCKTTAVSVLVVHDGAHPH